MPKKRVTPEQTIGLLRQAEVELARGRTVGEVCRRPEVSEAGFCRRRAEHGGLKADQVRRMRELEREDARLERAAAEPTLGRQIPREAAEGGYQAPGAAGPVSATCGARSAPPSAAPAAPSVSRARRGAVCALPETTRRLRARRSPPWRPNTAAAATAGSRRCRAPTAGGRTPGGCSGSGGARG